MRGFALILVLTLPWPLATADLVASGSDAANTRSGSTVQVAASVAGSLSPPAATPDQRCQAIHLDSPLLPNRALAATPPVAADDLSTELPPPPSSLALTLSGIAGLGVYQAGRSIRKLHLGHLPEWYHADATQLGHVTPLQLEFDHSALPVCNFDEPSGFRLSFSYRIPRERRSRVVFEPFIPVTAPRAPPGWLR